MVAGAAGFVGGEAIHLDFGDGYLIITEVTESRHHVANTHKGAIIDVNNKDLTNAFADFSKVEVTQNKGRIEIRAQHHESKVVSREAEITNRVKKGEPLRKGGL